MTPIDIDGKSNYKDIATAFRGFYANICDDFNALNEYLDVIDIRSSSSAPLPDLNVGTIERCIKNLMLSKSAGVDDIVAEHIVCCFPSIAI